MADHTTTGAPRLISFRPDPATAQRLDHYAAVNDRRSMNEVVLVLVKWALDLWDLEHGTKTTGRPS